MATPRVSLIGLHAVTTRTSVAVFSKSTSNSVSPVPGVNCTSITFMLGGRSTPSGGYTSLGSLPAAHGVAGRSGNFGQLPLQPPSTVACSLTCRSAAPVRLCQLARTMVVPPLVTLEVNCGPLIAPSDVSSSDQEADALTSWPSAVVTAMKVAWPAGPPAGRSTVVSGGMTTRPPAPPSPNTLASLPPPLSATPPQPANQKRSAHRPRLRRMGHLRGK